jgi:hypothetical protein
METEEINVRGFWVRRLLLTKLTFPVKKSLSDNAEYALNFLENILYSLF